MVDPEDLSATDDAVFNDPELRGIECNACFRALAYKFFQKDSSYRTGYKPTCIACMSAPRLSMEEHLDKLTRENYNSEGVRRQRHEDQEEFRRTEARWGKTIHASEFLVRLHRLVPGLIVAPGGIEGDVSLFLTAPGPQAKWDGRDFKYLGYLEFDTLPEHSIYEFDEQRDILVRATRMGWRSVLLRFIKAGVLTEEDCNKEFGYPSLGNSNVWFKQLHRHRNARRVESAA